MSAPRFAQLAEFDRPGGTTDSFSSALSAHRSFHPTLWCSRLSDDSPTTKPRRMSFDAANEEEEEDASAQPIPIEQALVGSLSLYVERLKNAQVHTVSGTQQLGGSSVAEAWQ